MRIPGWLFWSLIPISMRSTSNPALGRRSRPLMRFFGAATLLMTGGRRQQTLADVGREWQRMFTERDEMPITSIDDETIHAEIRVHCPYRGTGNVAGCYRMMEYDRRMLEKIGGEFVVLRSQAEPGVTVCQVAIRRAGASMEDLVPAHVRTAAATGD